MVRGIARLGLGLVLGSFGVWELSAPSLWIGYIPPVPAVQFQAVPAVLAHGWVLLMLATAAWINFLPAVTAWLSVAAVTEVAALLLWRSGISAILVRDVGLLALALIWAVEETGLPLRSPRGASSGAAPPAV